MEYKFIIDYTPTDQQGTTSQRECLPLYGDDMSVTKNMESGEWFLRRMLEGKMTFVRDDYDWIMGRDFDGTFKMTVQSSTDGTNWYDYFTGSFSRANLEIDEDNQRAVLNGLSEGDEYNVIENARREEYDLMKVIPDGDAKEMQGQVHPALALVDYRSSVIQQSDMYCDVPFVSGGYKNGGSSGYSESNYAYSNYWWNLIGIYAEAKVEMKEGYEAGNGFYIGTLQYYQASQSIISGIVGQLDCESGYYMRIVPNENTFLRKDIELYDNNNNLINKIYGQMPGVNSPSSYEINLSSFEQFHINKIAIIFHYIRATLLTMETLPPNGDVTYNNSLDTGDYYKGMQAFYNDGGLNVTITTNTSETPNGHRLIPGTGEQGTTPQYFAPPDESHDWIPLAEDNWNYGSMWYTIAPSVANGLLDPDKIGSFRWTRCWTLGTCLNRLLRKITDNEVTFDESTAGSEFLYSTINPVTNGEPFEYLFTQKSNVMNPGQGNTGESAARCTVTLDWFLEFMRNGLNLYWWLEPRNGGTYAFRVEHVEWFRRGGSYTGQLNAQINLTEIKPLRNFLRNGDAAKRLDDQLHKYTYDMQGMTEKYTFSWQGDGGSDAFKGHPMIFRAGWVEKGSSESHEVDNIFADLAWLMLNAGSDTASAQNYEGVFIFSGYRPDYSDQWAENKVAPSELVLNAVGVGNVRHVDIDVWLTMDEGVTAELVMGSTVLDIWSGTGEKMLIRINVRAVGNLTLEFTGGGGGEERVGVTIHRIHAHDGYVYNVPNVENLLGDGYLQNGPLAWPWLQNEYLHYDVPARRWGFKADSADELDNIQNGWLNNGTVKLCKKQEVPLLPLPTKGDEDNLDLGVIGGLRDSNNQLQTGIVKEAKINLSSRNASLTLMYDMIS